MRIRVAVLDDERRMVDAIALVLDDTCTVTPFTDPEAALEAIARERFEVVVTDLRMPGLSGLEVLGRIRRGDAPPQVILLTAHASVPTAVTAMRDGAFDFIEKPFANDELRALVTRAAEVARLERENRVLRAELGVRDRLDPKRNPERIVAESAAMSRVLELVHKVARSRTSVLLTGESGTGKEVIARALHTLSDRFDAPFEAVNTKALAESVAESELFGHEKGAFTGAHRERAGLFERAAGGTVFLDEIGEVSADFQAKLLRVLEEREVHRVGGSTPIPIDVRVIAATNRDLPADVAAGRFREDLYFRLGVFPIHLPALRDRRQDIPALADLFLERLNQERQHPLAGFTEAATRRLFDHPWPGNVRELENAVERGALLASGERIDEDDLLLDSGPGTVRVAPHGTLRQAMDEAARQRIQAALDDARGSRQVAAEHLGIERTTLYRWLRRLDLEEEAEA